MPISDVSLAGAPLSNSDSERNTPVKGWLPLDRYLDGSKSMTLGDVDRTELNVRRTIMEKKREIEELKEEADATRNSVTPSERMWPMKHKPQEHRNRLWRIEQRNKDILRMKKSLVDLAEIEKRITELRQKVGAELRAKHKVRRDAQRRRRLVSEQEYYDHGDGDEHMEGTSPATLDTTAIAFRPKLTAAIVPASNTPTEALNMLRGPKQTNNVDSKAKTPTPTLGLPKADRQKRSNIATPPSMPMSMSMVLRPKQINNVALHAQPPAGLINMGLMPRNIGGK